MASDRNFYGTAQGGGVRSAGTIFRATATGFDTIYNFCTGTGVCLDGAFPQGDLIQGSDGALYGTTYGGGAVFKITLSGVFTKLYSFCSEQPNCADGMFPQTSLIQAIDGNIFGTTSSGGLV